MANSLTYGKKQVKRNDVPSLVPMMASNTRGGTKGGFLLLLFACLLLLGLSLWSLLCASGVNDPTMQASFSALAAEGLLFAVILVAKNERSGIYMFEPFAIVTFVMILVYFVAPIFQFAAGSTSRYGVDVSKYCPIATALVMAGYFMFFIAYEFPIKRKRRGCKASGPAYHSILVFKAQKLVVWAYAIWFVAYVLNLFYYVNRGFDLTYVILGGLTGSEDNGDIIDGNLSFLAYLKYTLLGAWMMIYAYDDNKFGKIALYILTLLCMFLGGGRMTLLIALLAPVVFYYARSGKSPRFSYVLLAIAGLVALFAFMQVARVGLRLGTGVDVTGISIGEFLNPFYAEIDDFKSYYALLGTVPQRHDFLYGSQMFLYSLVILIPRAVFPAKPDPVVHEIVYLSLGNQAVLNGNAYQIGRAHV